MLHILQVHRSKEEFVWYYTDCNLLTPQLQHGIYSKCDGCTQLVLQFINHELRWLRIVLNSKKYQIMNLLIFILIIACITCVICCSTTQIFILFTQSFFAFEFDSNSFVQYINVHFAQLSHWPAERRGDSQCQGEELQEPLTRHMSVMNFCHFL